MKTRTAVLVLVAASFLQSSPALCITQNGPNEPRPGIITQMLAMADADQQRKTSIKILNQYRSTKDSRPNALEHEILSLLKDPRSGSFNAKSLLKIFRESNQALPPGEQDDVPLKDLTAKFVPVAMAIPRELTIITFERSLCCSQDLIDPDYIFIYYGDKVFSVRGHTSGVKMPDAHTVVFRVTREGYPEKPDGHDIRDWDELWSLDVRTDEFRKTLDITWNLGYRQAGSDYALFSPSRSALGESFDPIDAYYREYSNPPQCNESTYQIYSFDYRSPYFIHKRYTFDAVQRKYHLINTAKVDKSAFLVLASEMCDDSGRFPSGDSLESAYQDFLWQDKNPISNVLEAYPHLTASSQRLMERLVRAAVPEIGVGNFAALIISPRRGDMRSKLREHYIRQWCDKAKAR